MSARALVSPLVRPGAVQLLALLGQGPLPPLLRAWGRAGGSARRVRHPAEALAGLQDGAPLLVVDEEAWPGLAAGLPRHRLSWAGPEHPRLLLLTARPGRLPTGVDAWCARHLGGELGLEVLRQLLLPRYGLLLPRLHGGNTRLKVLSPASSPVSHF